jgi:Zn-dependent M28 family amino/carboxypeptidase
VRLSDHSPFWDQGYDALMVTDTSFMRNPYYHQMSDTVETLDLPFFSGVVEGLAEGLGDP